jgi:hypothetical protein
MGSAFESALDKLHAEADEVFGVQARFRSADLAEPVACWVEKLQPEPEFGPISGKVRTPAPALLLMARVSAFPRRPQKGDVFDLLAADGVTVTQTLHVIGSATIDDDDGRRYTIKVEAA